MHEYFNHRFFVIIQDVPYYMFFYVNVSNILPNYYYYFLEGELMSTPNFFGFEQQVNNKTTTELCYVFAVKGLPCTHDYTHVVENPSS